MFGGTEIVIVEQKKCLVKQNMSLWSRKRVWWNRTWHCRAENMFAGTEHVIVLCRAETCVVEQKV